jgi:hypothetical protein
MRSKQGFKIMPLERIPTDVVFGFNADYNTELDSNMTEMNLNSSQNKRAKILEQTINRDFIWARSLLNPALEHQFTKFNIVSIISHSCTTLICELIPEITFSQANNRKIIGYFNIWWWQDILRGLEFSYLKQLFECFPFLQNIYQQKPINHGLNSDLIYLKEPKLVQDRADPSRTLLTCRKFLLLNKQ